MLKYGLSREKPTEAYAHGYQDHNPWHTVYILPRLDLCQNKVLLTISDMARILRSRTTWCRTPCRSQSSLPASFERKHFRIERNIRIVRKRNKRNAQGSCGGSCASLSARYLHPWAAQAGNQLHSMLIWNFCAFRFFLFLFLSLSLPSFLTICLCLSFSLITCPNTLFLFLIFVCLSHFSFSYLIFFHIFTRSPFLSVFI